MPVNSLIVGVDLAPIKPIPRVITFQSDITTEKCRATIRQHLKTWKADTVLHDGAPNVGTAWVQDSFNQAELALQSLKLATEFLVEGGTFVTKVFRSKDYNPLLWVLNQLFNKVEATKPPSSRNVSAEIFVVCRGFKAPKRIDPRFLDPRYVFAELSGATPNNEAKVYNPEVKKRKRDGYDEGDYIQFKEVPASEFIQTTDPIAILGSCNKLAFSQPRNGDVALAALDKLPETTEEIRNCCQDLKVLGRKDFKLLLKWRLKVRDIFGFSTKEEDSAETATGEEVAQVESMDEELRFQEDLQNMKDRENAKKKRERRKENEKKQREIVRMQLHMVAPMDIGMEESGPIGEGAMFSMKAADKSNALQRLNRGKMLVVPNQAQATTQFDAEPSDDEENASDDEEDILERELDSMYDNYRERKAEADAKYRAKKAREERGDDEWEGISADEGAEKSETSDLEEENDSSDEDDEDLPARSLLTNLDDSAPSADGLSKKAAAFFSQDIFKDLTGHEREDGMKDGKAAKKAAVDERFSQDTQQNGVEASSKKRKDIRTTTKLSGTQDNSDGDDDFEVVKNNNEEDWEEEKRLPDGKLGKPLALVHTCLYGH
jgi:AdoMet-dependent rRNA methyltransferase SPB1